MNVGGKGAFYPAVEKLSTAATGRNTSCPARVRRIPKRVSADTFTGKGLRLDRASLGALGAITARPARAVGRRHAGGECRRGSPHVAPKGNKR